MSGTFNVLTGASNQLYRLLPLTGIVFSSSKFPSRLISTGLYMDSSTSSVAVSNISSLGLSLS